jgi:hypothetical protein
MTQMQPPTQPMPRMMQPHRGTTVLVLGILSLVLCQLCGIFAWVMGSRDLREMDAGRMDPEGRGLTQAGKVCGMIGTLILCVGVFFYLVVVVILGVSLAAGAAGAAGGGAPVGP